MFLITNMSDSTGAERISGPRSISSLLPLYPLWTPPSNSQLQFEILDHLYGCEIHPCAYSQHVDCTPLKVPNKLPTPHGAKVGLKGLPYRCPYHPYCVLARVSCSESQWPRVSLHGKTNYHDSELRSTDSGLRHGAKNSCETFRLGLKSSKGMGLRAQAPAQAGTFTLLFLAQ